MDVDLGGATWRKSTYSNGSGGECVEVAGPEGRVAVRDTMDRQGPSLTFTPEAWRMFAARIKDAH